MRALQAQGFGGPEVLEIVELPDPVAAEGQVVVRITGAAVNPVDWYTVSGALAAMHPTQEPPLVPGWDFAGVVVADGGGFSAGQRVAGMVPWFGLAAGRTGAYAELLLADAGWLTAVPDALDDTVAAALPLNALTAAQALDLVGVAPGQVLLVTGASGAVGGAAVQLAAAAGAHVVAVASTGDEEWVASLGAKEVIGRSGAEELVQAAHRLQTGGVDAVLDAVPLGPDLVGAVRDGGAFVTVLGPLAPAPERGIRVAAVSVAPDAQALARLVAQAAGGGLAVRVAGTLGLAEGAEAHRRAAAGGVRGKIVLRP